MLVSRIATLSLNHCTTRLACTSGPFLSCFLCHTFINHSGSSTWLVYYTLQNFMTFHKFPMKHSITLLIQIGFITFDCVSRRSMHQNAIIIWKILTKLGRTSISDFTISVLIEITLYNLKSSRTHDRVYGPHHHLDKDFFVLWQSGLVVLL